MFRLPGLKVRAVTVFGFKVFGFGGFAGASFVGVCQQVWGLSESFVFRVALASSAGFFKQ